MVVHEINLLLSIIDLIATDQPKVGVLVECLHLAISLRVLGRDSKIWHRGELMSSKNGLNILLV